MFIFYIYIYKFFLLNSILYVYKIEISHPMYPMYPMYPMSMYSTALT